MRAFADTPTEELEAMLDACMEGRGVLTAEQYDAALTEWCGRIETPALPLEPTTAPTHVRGLLR